MTTCKHYLEGMCRDGRFNGIPAVVMCLRVCKVREEGGEVSLESELEKHRALLELPESERPKPKFYNGPGQELRELLKKIGIKATPTCKCAIHALEMDVRGPDWCASNMETILGWLREEARKRKLPFNHLLAGLMVKRAIRTHRKKAS